MNPDNRHRLAWAATAFFVAAIACVLAGCNVMANFDKSRGLLAEATKGCYGSMTAINIERQDAIQADVRAHKISGDSATAELDSWLVTYKQGATVCKAGDELAQTAKNARPIIEAAVDKKKQVGDWIARIGAFVATIPASLARLGITGGP